MEYQLYVYGHNEYEPTNEFFKGNSEDEVYFKVRWQHPYLNKNAFELKITDKDAYFKEQAQNHEICLIIDQLGEEGVSKIGLWERVIPKNLNTEDTLNFLRRLKAEYDDYKKTGDIP